MQGQSQWYQALTEADPAAAEVLQEWLEQTPSFPPADPEAAAMEASAWISNQYPCPDTVIVPGAPQASLIEPLLKQMSDLRVLLVDRDAGRLAGTLNGIDSETIATAIRENRLVVDPGEEENVSIDRFMRAADFSRVPAIRMLDARPVAAADEQMVDEMTRPARELLRWQACDMSTRLNFGPDWQSQTLRNLPAIVKHPPVSSLFNQFKGKPAWVVAAGPSLDEVFPYFEAAKGRMVLICVARMMARLLAYGKIMPTLVVTGDGQELVKNHFKKKPEGLEVVASCFTHPAVIKDLDRIFFMEMESMGMPDWMRTKMQPRGEIYAGGNVATASLALAAELGCNPIITIGLDLSYSSTGKTHSRGKPGELSQTKLPDDRIYYDVPGNYQDTVKTNRQMMHYIEFTEDLVAHYNDRTFVNVNTGGAKIRGMELARPEDLLHYLAPERFSPRSIVNQVYKNYTRDLDILPLLDSLREDVPQLQSLRAACMDAAMVCNRMIMLMRRPGKREEAEATARALLDDLAVLDERLKSDPVMNLIEARLAKATRMLSERMMTPEERALPPAIRSHWRWREYYKGVAEACRRTILLLEEAISSIEQDAGLMEANDLDDLRITQPEHMEVLA